MKCILFIFGRKSEMKELKSAISSVFANLIYWVLPELGTFLTNQGTAGSNSSVPPSNEIILNL